MRKTWLKRATVTATGGGIALALAVSAGPANSAVGATSPTGNPFVGRHLYVDPNSSAHTAADARRATDPAGAALLDKVASQPVADWFGGWNPTATVASTVRQRVQQITAAAAYPVLVLYDIPGLDCGPYGTPGAPNGAAYRAWIDQVALGIGKATTAVIIEPDALASMSCLTSAQQTERLGLVKYAAQKFSGLGHTNVYLDAGHAGWQPASVMSARLNKAGVVYARGFSLNVSNYDATSSELAFGRSVAAGSGWKHFVVDTGRNGLGANGEWCNASGRALGERPTAVTSDPLADAFLWVKPPGESDGTCNGGPAAGTFWPDYAIGLAQRAAW